MTPDERFAEIRRVGGDSYQALLSAGYRERHDMNISHCTPFLLQKRIDGPDGVPLYFINVWVYDRQDQNFAQRVAYQPEFHTTSRDGIVFSVTMIEPAATVATIESFFRELYDRLECRPYGD